MLHPPETVPPNPMSNPPTKRRGSSCATGSCQRAVPADSALSQLPRGTPISIYAPQVIGWEAWSTSAPRSVLLGPVMDNPQCQPAGSPSTQANVPSIPSTKPVRCQSQLPGDRVGFGKIDSKNPSTITPPAIIQAGFTFNRDGIDAAPDNATTGPVSNSVRKRKGPYAATNPPVANPKIATPAPRFPVPTRDQIDVAQPLAHIIPKPNMRPPTTAASHVSGGTGRTRSRASARAFTRTS